MTKSKEIVSREIGKLRIYVKPIEKVRKKGWKAMLFPQSLYKEIIQKAKEFGIMTASVHNTYYGYSNQEKIQMQHVETDNSHLNIYVELIDNKKSLEDFCKEHHDLLEGKIIIYKHIEQWNFKNDDLIQSDNLEGE